MNDERLSDQIRHGLPALSEPDIDELARVIKCIVAALAPSRIYVFGSQSRGEATADSDIDLLLVVQDTETPSYRLAQAAYRAATPYRFSLDILVMTQEEFDSRGRAVTSLPATVLREGWIVYAVEAPAAGLS